MIEESDNDTGKGRGHLRLVSVVGAPGQRPEAHTATVGNDRHAAIAELTNRLQQDTERLLARNVRLEQELCEAENDLRIQIRVVQLLTQARPSKPGLRSCIEACEKVLSQQLRRSGLANSCS